MAGAIACAGDDAGPASGTSGSDTTQGPPTSDAAGPTSDASGVGPSTGPDTVDSTGDPDDTGTETSATDTGEIPVEARVAVILLTDLDTPGVDELYRVDYVDGGLTEPSKISGPAGAGVVQPSLSPDESMLFYRPLDPEAATIEYEYVPLDAGQAGPTSPMHQAPAPDDGLYGPPTIFADETRIAYYGAVASDTGARFYLADVTADAVQAPEVAVELPDGLGGGGLILSASEDWVSFLRDPAPGGPTNGWIAPLSPLDPGGAVQVTDLDEPAQGMLSAPVFVPGDEALWYRADRDVDQLREIFFVDLSGATPAAPVKVNDPPAPGEDLQPVRLSPDRLQLAYFVGADLRGEVHVATFDGATVSTPQRVSTLGDQQAYPANITWSPDGRWLVYLAEHQQPDALDVYAIDMSGAVPSGPMLVSSGGVVPGSSAPELFFDDDGGWLYIGGEIDSDVPELYRCDLSGAMPGPVQRVSAEVGPAGAVLPVVILSNDSNWALYFVDDGARSLWMVDVSGDQAGEAQRVHGRLSAGEEHGFFTRWSPDDRAILYRTQSDASPARPLYIVERDALTEPVLVAEDPEAVIVMDFLP